MNTTTTPSTTESPHMATDYDKYMLTPAWQRFAKKVKHLFGHDVSSPDKLSVPSRDTPLHVAVRYNNAQIVSALLAQGHDTNLFNAHGQTPLHLARSKEVAQALVAHGAAVDANSSDAFGVRNTPLHTAAAAGNLDTVFYLLSEGADVHARNRFDSTALHLAAATSSAAVVAALLDKGAAVDTANQAGQTALHLLAGATADSNTLDTLELLVSHHADINKPDNTGKTPLAIRATHSADIGFARELIARGAAVCTPDLSGNTPLHHAATNGRPDLITLLLKHGADINAQNHKHLRPIDDAIQWGQLHAVRLLLNKGANHEPCHDTRPSPMTRAVRGNNAAIVSDLLSAGATVDNGHLDEAVRNWKKNVLAPLLATLADPVLPDDGAVIYADRMSHLLRSGLPVSALHRYVHVRCNQYHHGTHALERRQLVRLALDHGLTLDDTADSGNSLLHGLCKHGADGADLKALLNACDTTASIINKPDPDGNTPLHLYLASAYCAPSLLGLSELLAAGADPALPDARGCSAVQLLQERQAAANHSPRQQEELARLLNALHPDTDAVPGSPSAKKGAVSAHPSH